MNWTMPEGTGDPGSIPWLCAALFIGGLLMLVIRGRDR